MLCVLGPNCVVCIGAELVLGPNCVVCIGAELCCVYWGRTVLCVLGPNWYWGRTGIGAELCCVYWGRPVLCVLGPNCVVYIGAELVLGPNWGRTGAELCCVYWGRTVLCVLGPNCVVCRCTIPHDGVQNGARIKSISPTVSDLCRQEK